MGLCDTETLKPLWPRAVNEKHLFIVAVGLIVRFSHSCSISPFPFLIHSATLGKHRLRMVTYIWEQRWGNSARGEEVIKNTMDQFAYEDTAEEPARSLQVYDKERAKMEKSSMLLVSIKVG